ncbi:hypothetical protein ACFQ4U_08870 [Micrococcus antarcticus]
MSASLGEAVGVGVGVGDSDGFLAVSVGDGSAVAEACAVAVALFDAGALEGASEAFSSSLADSSARGV